MLQSSESGKKIRFKPRRQTPTTLRWTRSGDAKPEVETKRERARRLSIQAAGDRIDLMFKN